MSSIKIKSFLGPKSGVDYHDGEDRMAMNVKLGRFAVADGVSQSYLPNLWAEILCEAFVKSHVKADADWIEQYAANKMVSDCHFWAQQSEIFLNNGTEDENFWLQIKRDKYHYAGSTLVGIAITKKSLYYNVLGDSCLFLFNQETKELTSYSTVNEQEGFTNRPDFLCSAGNVIGKCKFGQLPLTPGYVLLATDKVSEWIIKRYPQDPHLLEQLWSLDSHEAFISLVEESRRNNSMDDDDVALMIFQIESEIKEGFEVLFCDKMVSLLGQGEATPSLKLAPSENNIEDITTDMDETVCGDLNCSKPINNNYILEHQTHEVEYSSPEINEIEQKEESIAYQSKEAMSFEVEITDCDAQDSDKISDNDINTVDEVLMKKKDESTIEPEFELDENKEQRELGIERDLEDTNASIRPQSGMSNNASNQSWKNYSIYETACINIRWILRKVKRRLYVK